MITEVHRDRELINYKCPWCESGIDQPCTVPCRPGKGRPARKEVTWFHEARYLAMVAAKARSHQNG